MNKTELAAKVAETMKESQVKGAAALNAVLASIGEALAKGEAVTIADFGKFEVKEKAARQGRNPRTGETVNIPAGRKITFRPGRGLKEAAGATPANPARAK